jgi:hypothetical protein
MPVIGQELAPHFYVAVLHPGKLPVQIGLPGVPFRLRQLPVEERGVGFIFEMVEPGVGGCRRG